MFAGAAAAMVLVAGVMWPSGEGNGAESPVRSAGTSSAQGEARGDAAAREVSGADPAASSAPVPVEQTASPEPPAVASVLWRQIIQCGEADDLECSDAVAPGSAGIVEALSAKDGAKGEFIVLDEYGDIAVVRVDAVDAPTTDGPGDSAVRGTVVVLVRLNEKWLVRDVYDVADQPG